MWQLHCRRLPHSVPPSLLCLSFLFSLSAFFCFFRRIHCTWAESASPFQFLLSTKQAGKGNRERERGVKPVPARCLLMSKFRVTSSIGCIGCLSCPVSRVHVHVMDIACELANFAEFLCRILPLNEMESKWRQGGAGRRKWHCHWDIYTIGGWGSPVVNYANCLVALTFVVVVVVAALAWLFSGCLTRRLSLDPD